jgi:hypothetical protein
MTDFALTLEIDPDDLTVIRSAQQRLTLAKPVDGAEPNVIWLSIDPFQTTLVTWVDEYGIYASTSEIREGTTLIKMADSPLPALAGSSYTLTSGGVFTGPFSSGGLPSTVYGAKNDVPYDDFPKLTFGLSQSAAVNGNVVKAPPLTAVPVLATQSARLAPSPTTFVWLQAQFGSQVVIHTVRGAHAKVTLTSDESRKTLKYDPRLGVFVPVTAAGLRFDDPAVTLVTPTLF